MGTEDRGRFCRPCRQCFESAGGQQEEDELFDPTNFAWEPLAKLGPRCNAVCRIAYLQCRALISPCSEEDVQELLAAEADAVELAGSTVVVAVRDISRRLLWDAEGRQKSMDVAGERDEAFEASKPRFEDSARAILEEQLLPLLGRQRAEALWSMCRRCVQHRVHEKRSWHADATVDLLWMTYHARRMGFDLLPPVSGNHALAMLCLHKCRSWTAEHMGMPLEIQEVRAASLQIAEAEAKGRVDAAVVDLVLDLTSELRSSAWLERLADRRHPVLVVLNLFVDPRGQSLHAMAAAHHILETWLEPLVGKRAREIWAVCLRCAWHEQNRYEYDSAVWGRITGSRACHLQAAREDWRSVLEHEALMGFSAG